MAASFYMKEQEFPEVMDALNRLADLVKKQCGVRPSIRQLAADILFTGASQRISAAEKPTCDQSACAG